jgi:hypothetical protein
MKNICTIFIVFLMVLGVSSCEKEAGEGGTSTLYGKVLIRKYNPMFTVLMEEYYAQDQEVYIIYGNDRTFSQRIRTNYDGTYEFKYLRQGEYKIFAYSKDSTLSTNALIPVIKEIKIEQNRQEIEVPLIIIFK